MSKITKTGPKNHESYKIVIPKVLAEDFVEEHGNDVKVKKKGKKLIIEAVE